jgi:hypothetical protein
MSSEEGDRRRAMFGTGRRGNDFGFGYRRYRPVGDRRPLRQMPQP